MHFSAFRPTDMSRWLNASFAAFVGDMLKSCARNIGETYVEMLLTTGLQVKASRFVE